MNWLLRNWYGLAGFFFLVLAIVELFQNGSTMKFWADLILCFICQVGQAILTEIRKIKG